VRLSLRSLWSLVTPLTIVVCAIFAAKTVSNLTASEELADAPHAAPSPQPTPKREPKPVAVHSKSPDKLVARNMFCSTCSGEDAPPSATSPSNRTLLPLRLIATNIASQSEYSFASILNTSDQRQGGYRVGQEIPGAGVVESIQRESLAFFNTSNQRSETIHFDGGEVTVAAPSRAASASSNSNALAEEYVRVIDATHFEVDRKLVETLKGDPKQAGAMARPVVKEGKMQGVRLFAVRSSGLAHAMGLRNGDTLMAANGVKLESYEAALELMGRLQTKDHWSVDIERRGGPLTLSIDLQ
jgi:general secretion pathway protein C